MDQDDQRIASVGDATDDIFLCAQGGGTLTEVWTRLGPISDTWQEGQVTVASKDVFFILVGGVRGDTPNGRIGLDSVVLIPEPCKIPGEGSQCFSSLVALRLPHLNNWNMAAQSVLPELSKKKIYNHLMKKWTACFSRVRFCLTQLPGTPDYLTVYKVTVWSMSVLIN